MVRQDINKQQDRSSIQINKIKARSDWDSRIVAAEPNPDLMKNPHYWGGYCRGMYQRYLKKYNIQPKKRITPVLVRLSKNSQRYAVDYRGQRIGIIKPGIDCWIAAASLQYGAIENKLDTRTKAVNWLVNNFLKVDRSGIKFNVSCDRCHYTIEKSYWLIKIDVLDEDIRATIQDGNNLDYRYFPDLNSAVMFSFDLILNQDRSNSNNYNREF